MEENWGDMDLTLDPDFDIDDIDIYPEDFNFYHDTEGMNPGHFNPSYATTNDMCNSVDPEDTIQVSALSQGFNKPNPPYQQYDPLPSHRTQRRESPGEGSSAHAGARRITRTNTTKNPAIMRYQFRDIESLEKDLEQAKASGKTGVELRPYEVRIVKTRTYQRKAGKERVKRYREQAMENVIIELNSPEETYSDPEEQKRALNRRSQRRVRARKLQDCDDYFFKKQNRSCKKYRGCLRVVCEDMDLSTAEVQALPREERRAAMAKVRAQGLAPTTGVAQRLSPSQRPHHTRAAGKSIGPNPEATRVPSSSPNLDLTLVELYNRNQVRSQGATEMESCRAGKGKVMPSIRTTPNQDATQCIDPRLLQVNDKNRTRRRGRMNLQCGQASIDKEKGTARPLQDFATSPAHATSPARVASSSPHVPGTDLGGASAQAIRDRSRSRTLRADSYDDLQDLGLYNAPSPVRPAGNLHESSSLPSSRSREPTPRSREATPRSQSSGADSSWNGFSSSPSPFPAPSQTNHPEEKGERRTQQIPTGKGKKVIAPRYSRWGSTTSRAAVKPGLRATRPV
jgi:hypothetical protein